MSNQRKEYLLKLARGKSFRSALKAVAELRTMNDAGLAGAVAQGRAPDEQREFQRRIARLVLERGIEGLVAEWTALGDAKWRAELISEIGQFLHLWVYPATVELGLAALEDPSREVQIKSIWMFLGFVREPSAKERKPEKTESGRRYQEAANTLRGWITPARRSRMTRGFAAMLERHRREPYPVLPEVVELIGYTANKEDRQAIALLEELRLKSGEPHRVSYERVDKANFEWFEKLALAKKGVAPEEMVRIKHTPTGLLDKKLLERSLARIRERAPRAGDFPMDRACKARLKCLLSGRVDYRRVL